MRQQPVCWVWWPCVSVTRACCSLVLAASGSHVVIHLVKKYPQYRIVNFDKLDYCSSLKNLASIEDYPNYSFIKVRERVPLCVQVVWSH